MTGPPDFLTGDRPTADRDSDWSRVNAVVVGLGGSGFAAADALLEFGARVTVLDDGDSDTLAERRTILETLDAIVRLGPGSTAQLPQDTHLVVPYPGLSPSHPLLTEAAARGIAIWGEPELAWRLSGGKDHPRPAWLGVTGTNGKTTTVQMLQAMMEAAGLRSALVGNIGRPVMETVLEREPYEVVVVELSSFQLHWSNSLALHSAAVLNLHPDHLEWYDHCADPIAAYGADKALIFERVTHACVYNVAEPATEDMVAEADVTEGARAIGFTLGTPGLSMIGVVDDLIVDRAFVEQRRSSALELAGLNDVQPAAPHNVANALAAAALARSFGVPAAAVRDGLRKVELGGHRIAEVATADGITWIDDSKATNPHAAQNSLLARDQVVWVAGGQAKGVTFDELVLQVRDRLRGAVLIGVDREVIADALRRHAPEVPLRVIDSADTGTMEGTGTQGTGTHGTGTQGAVMDRVVAAAAAVAQPGDAVVLAPGCASLDMWSGYGARGDDFAAAVRRHIDQGAQ